MLENPYLYLSIVSLTAKIWAAHRLSQDTTVPGAKLCLLFLFVAYSMTVMEFYCYYLVSYGHTNIDITLLLRLYYVLVYAFLLILPLLFNHIIQSKNSALTILSHIVIFCCISLLTLNSDIIVSGASVLTYTITRAKGEHYWVFVLFVLYTLTITLINLWKSSKNQKSSELARLKSINLMIGFIPVFGTLFTVVALMELGVLINAVGLLTLSLAALIFIMAENLRTDRILDLRVYLPWTEKARMIRQLTKPFREVTLEPETAKGLSSEYDKSLIRTAKQMFPTQKDAAAWLGITESKMSRMLKK